MTDYATNAAKEIREAQQKSALGSATVEFMASIISRHRDERVQRLLDVIFACQKDRDGGYDALASAWWDVVCETAEEIRRSRK